MAVSALLLLLDMCLRPGADAAVRAAVFKSVRAAAADPGWTQGLVSTLNDLHGAFDGINTNSPGAMLQSLPEASLLLQLRQPPVTARRHEGTLHLSPEPHGPTKDPSAAQRGPLHGVSLRLTFFLEALMRIAPDPIIAAVKGPASEFSTLPPEVRWSKGSTALLSLCSAQVSVPTCANPTQARQLYPQYVVADTVCSSLGLHRPDLNGFNCHGGGVNFHQLQRT